MRLILEVIQGSYGEELVVSPGESLRIGNDPQWCDVSFEDTSLSAVHLVIHCDELHAYVRDSNTRSGTMVNGERITSAKIASGDLIAAGRIVLRAQLEAEEEAAADAVKEEAAAEDAGLSPIIKRLLFGIRQLPDPLFALVDCARDPRVLEIVADHCLDGQTLFEGQDLGRLIPLGPYLAPVDKEGKMIELLAKEGWGNSWMIFVISHMPFANLRDHLRSFLMCKNEEGQELYFRYYDPRVLRLFLPTCTQTEAHEFFGPILKFWVEDENPETLLEFTATARGAQVQKFSLTEEVPEPQPAGGRSA